VQLFEQMLELERRKSRTRIRTMKVEEFERVRIIEPPQLLGRCPTRRTGTVEQDGELAG
jgi:hypothetical protein